VITRIEKYDASRSKFSTWIFNQGKYAALNELRRCNRERRSEVAATSIETVEEIELYESSFSDDERRAAASALRRLTVSERELIRQRLVLDLSYDEIFEALGGSIKREHLRIYVSRAITR
jgi:RNA polymerase sigma factor (sigma-70 family)